MKQFLIILALFTGLTASAQKMHFQPVDKEFILEKIAKTNPGTWSLSKNTDVRHYGLTDEEFFKNFGNDRVGKIGSETSVNNKDKIGLNYVAIHALVKKNNRLRDELKLLANQVETLEKEISQIHESNQTVQQNMEKLDAISDMELLVKDLEMRVTDLEEQVEELKNN